MKFVVSCLANAAMAFCSLTVLADVTTFTETFAGGDANWQSGNFSPLNTFGSGGPDGSAFVSTDATFQFAADDDPLTIFRGQASNNASDGAFVGNWIASGVNELSFSVRHDSPLPLSFFARIATPGNFPAAIGLAFAPVFPGQWTDVTIDISETSPQLIYEGPASTFNSVFSSVGNLQIGTSVPTGFGGVPGSFTFDLDNIGVTAVPEPASGFALWALTATLLARRNRR